MIHITKEDIANRISELLIENFNEISTYFGGVDLAHFQKTVRSGEIQTGRTEDETIVVHESNIKSNETIVKLIDTIYGFLHPSGQLSDSLLTLDDIILTSSSNESTGGGAAFTFIINTPAGNNRIPITSALFDSLNQFIGIQKRRVIVDPKKAKQLLDTNIYELLPPVTTRQQQINKFFSEYNNLKPPSPRELNILLDKDEDTFTETFDKILAADYSAQYDISNAFENGLTNDKYITWLKKDENNKNENKSLEWLYKDLQENYFLQKEISVDALDDRPEYESKSEGYLKIRNFNQAIIIRNEKSNDIGLVGNDLENPLWQTKGFTITMWVRFLDKINGGTLFNFGNPFRENNPQGFTLETYVINKKDVPLNVSTNHQVFFGGDEFVRFVRLVVRESDNTWRDSTVGQQFFDKRNPIDSNLPLYNYDIGAGASSADSTILLNATHIPIDLNEWYYIVANYNPEIKEDESFNVADIENLNRNPDFWKWKVTPNMDTNVVNSGYGSKCKVEIISRSDLLTARGYKLSIEDEIKRKRKPSRPGAFSEEQMELWRNPEFQAEMEAQVQEAISELEPGQTLLDVVNEDMQGQVTSQIDIDFGFNFGLGTFSDDFDLFGGD